MADVDVAAIEALARSVAVTMGFRPRCDVVYAADLNRYTALTGERPPGRSRELRGLCGRGDANQRVIWVASNDPWAFLESLTHELAHALLPWRHGHTADWLQLHVDTLAHFTSPAHADQVRRHRTA